jgi:hypothetical protein
MKRKLFLAAALLVAMCCVSLSGTQAEAGWRGGYYGGGGYGARAGYGGYGYRGGYYGGGYGWRRPYYGGYYGRPYGGVYYY